MKKVWISRLGAVVVALGFSSAMAFCPKDDPQVKEGQVVSGEKGGCGHKHKESGATTVAGSPTTPCAAKKSGCCKSKGGSVEAVLASMPAIKYQVGEEVIDCPHAAKSMASKSPTPIKYKVADEAFDTESAAEVKLTTVLQQRLDDMQSLQYAVGGESCRCPLRTKELASKQGTAVAYRVGGFDFTEREKAEKALKLITEAAGQVQMACKSEGKTVECEKVASNPQAKLVYVVGDAETESKQSANLIALQAKIRKVVETAASVHAA